MESIEIIEIAERFQTTIVGFIGFIGVIWSIRSTARQSRLAQHEQHSNQRAKLRRMLAAEFRNHASALKKNLETISPEEDHVSVGKFSRTLAENSSPDLGLLELGEVDVVVNALISLQGIHSISEYLSVQSSETRFIIPQTALEEYLAITSTTLDALNLALEVLERSGEA